MMNLIEIQEKVFGVPHLASLRTLKNVVFIMEKVSTQEIALVQKDPSRREREIHYDGTNQVGVVEIRGLLTNNEDEWDTDCGITSYEKITGQVDLLVKKGLKTLVLDIDSGGGEAYGCFEAANYVKDLSREHGFKIMAYVDGYAASGGYAWAAIADELIMNPQAEVGSIGVVVQLMNTIKAEKQKGYERSYVYAGESKIPFDAEGNFTQEFLEDLQEKVDATYEGFVQHIVNHRGLSKEDVVATQAKTFIAGKSISLGLADKAMTKQEFRKYIEDLRSDNKSMGVFNSNSQSVSTQKLNEQLTTLQEELKVSQAEVLTKDGELKTTQSELAELKTQITGLKQSESDLQEKIQSMLTEGRKAKLSAVLPEDEVDEMLTTLANMDDAGFEKVLSTMKKSVEIQEKEMEEQGTSNAGTVQPQGLVATMKNVAANKYNKRPKA